MLSFGHTLWWTALSGSALLTWGRLGQDLRLNPACTSEAQTIRLVCVVKKNELHRVLNYHTTLVCLVAFVVVYYIVKNMWEVWYCKRSGWALVRPTVCLVIYPPRYPGIKLKTRNYLVAL